MFFPAISIFMWKHLKYHLFHWRLKCLIVVLTIGMPILSLIVNEQKHFAEECYRTDAMLYMLPANAMQTVSMINMILLPMIEENSTGVAEFLRIASKYSSFNVMTFFGIQLVVSVSMYGVVLLTAWLMKVTDHYDMSCMVVLVVLYATSSVAFSLLLSVVFKKGNRNSFSSTAVSICLILFQP